MPREDGHDRGHQDKTIASGGPDDDGHRGGGRRIDGFRAARRLSSRKRTGAGPAGEALLPCFLWRFRRLRLRHAWSRSWSWFRRLAARRPPHASASLMRRIACPERDDWQATAAGAGFDFHTIDGERYWDERAYYAFTLDEIERAIEQPTSEIDAMCLELVGRAVDDESYLRRLKIPEAFWPLISESWHRDDSSLYGRLDFSFDGHGPAKLLEYNADTPTSIFEAAVFQWTWLEQAIERHIIPAGADQFNSIHERLIEAWKSLGSGHHLHLTGTTESAEDA